MADARADETPGETPGGNEWGNYNGTTVVFEEEQAAERFHRRLGMWFACSTALCNKVHGLPLAQSETFTKQGTASRQGLVGGLGRRVIRRRSVDF